MNDLQNWEPDIFPLMGDRQVFADNISRFRASGAAKIRDEGILIDDVLRTHLSTDVSDTRAGVNLIVRPPRTIIEQIQHLQEHLKQWEPQQYYYPLHDLHLTLIEIAHSLQPQEADQIAHMCVPLLDDLSDAFASPVIYTFAIGFDQRGCAVNFLPVDETLQQIRQQIIDRLTKLDVPISSRYPPKSAHVSFMRYISPLQTNRERWSRILTELEPTIGLRWQMSEVWLTWGVTWYGMKSQITQKGPVRLK